ncbi:MAG: T9SS type A sorting domain-containing protein, partial [Candidatus Cloacimonetes bacterium]|nr:T9SS type A sorting domain-containing protein [Candidatus Cloacimonadota bacterium]
PVGHSAVINWDIVAEYDYYVNGNFSIIISQIPVYIWYPCNTCSDEAISTILDGLGISYESSSSLPENTSLYSSIFVLLGVYYQNHVLTESEGNILAGFLDNGGKIYMEGGDTWYYDPQTSFHSYFNINGVADGTSDGGPFEGVDGTFTEGMYFQYSGGNAWIDHLAPIGSAFTILRDGNNNYDAGVAYDSGNYKTIGCSFEFGGLNDAGFPSTKEELLSQYLNFFGLFGAPLYYDISGNICYFRHDDPVPNVEVSLTGNNNYYTSSDVSGLYLFAEIPEGNYTSTPYKADDLGGLSGMDASRIARYAAGLYSLDCIELIAGDVSMNGYISGMDASRVARYIAGLILQLNTSDINWVFTPEPIPECDDWPPIVYENTREYSPLESDLTDEDFIGIRLGDVSGNWSPDARMPLAQKSLESTKIEANINSTLKIPIIIDEVTAIEGIDICIIFNPEVLKLVELTLNKGILDNKDYAVETNLKDGKMVIYALKDLIAEKGIVAFIQFDVIGVEGSKSEIYFTKFDANETEVSGGFNIVDSKGNEIITKRLEANVVETLPEKFALYPNYPNPFTSKTVIRYDLPEDAQVIIQIYNVRGQLVKELVNGVEIAGRKQIEWNTKGLSSGIYFYRLSTKDKTFIKKMILMR